MIPLPYVKPAADGALVVMPAEIVTDGRSKPAPSTLLMVLDQELVDHSARRGQR